MHTSPAGETPDRVVRIPGDLIDRINQYFNDREEASEIEAAGGRPSFAGLDDEAACLVDLVHNRVQPSRTHDRIDDTAAVTGTNPPTVSVELTVGNIVDDEHLDELIDAVNAVGYTSDVHVRRDSDLDRTDVNEEADMIVNGGSPRTVEGLHLDYHDDTPGHLQVEVAGDPDPEGPIYTYPDAPALLHLGALFDALAVRVEQREQVIAMEANEN